MKYIREGRFGQPKTYKTGAVVSSYPRPLLVIELDPGGAEVVKEPLDIIRIEEFKQRLATPYDWKPVTVLDLSFRPTGELKMDYGPAPDKNSFEEFVLMFNTLMKMKPFPFKTVVLDPVTELSEMILRHLSVTSPAWMSDARKWAGNVGAKVHQIINYVNSLPCNTVCIFHSDVNKDELTAKTLEQPMLYSKFRDFAGAKFSQFFYQASEGGKWVVKTKPFALVQGIGARWPTFDKESVGATFQDIYGREGDVYK